jgi:hypothetical protein
MTVPDDPVSAGQAVVAERIMQAAASCPAVAGLSGGPYGTVATYLPGRTLLGVAVRAGEIEVCVTVWYGLALAAAAQQVRDAVAAVAPGRTVNVIIGDVAVPGSVPSAMVTPPPPGIGMFEPPGPGVGSPRPGPGPLGRGA